MTTRVREGGKTVVAAKRYGAALTDARPEKIRVMTISQAVSRYMGELVRDNKAASTLHRYQRYLDELADMYPWVDVEDVTYDQWVRWLDRICAGRRGQKLDIDTVSQRVTIAKCFTAWLTVAEILERDPLGKVKPGKRKNPVENDNVKWLTPEETQRMLAVAGADIGLKKEPADKYRKMLCLGVLCYTGGRRGAVSKLRIGAYDGMSDPPMLAFSEKGGKFIKKPVSRRLADLIREAQLAGVWDDPNDYLVPPLGTTRNAERDSRIIYRLVTEVAQDAKVAADVHTMRRSFACYFLENNPDQLYALKDLMGHSSVQVTEMYLRRMNRQKGMEVVVDLDWGHTTPDMFQALGEAEKEGFEPSFQVDRPSKPNDCLKEQP